MNLVILFYPFPSLFYFTSLSILKSINYYFHSYYDFLPFLELMIKSFTFTPLFSFQCHLNNLLLRIQSKMDYHFHQVLHLTHFRITINFNLSIISPFILSTHLLLYQLPHQIIQVFLSMQIFSLIHFYFQQMLDSQNPPCNHLAHPQCLLYFLSGQLFFYIFSLSYLFPPFFLILFLILFLINNDYDQQMPLMTIYQFNYSNTIIIISLTITQLYHSYQHYSHRSLIMLTVSLPQAYCFSMLVYRY